MIWTLNMIVSANLRRVSLGISANVPSISAVATTKNKITNENKYYYYEK